MRKLEVASAVLKSRIGKITSILTENSTFENLFVVTIRTERHSYPFNIVALLFIYEKKLA